MQASCLGCVSFQTGAQLQVLCPGLFFCSSAGVGSCTSQREFPPAGIRQLLVLVPGPITACLPELHGSRSESRTGACCPLLKRYGYFFFQRSSWKTGKAIRAVGCSFLWLSLLEVTNYPQLATLEPVPRVPWASTLLSHTVSTCRCLLLGTDLHTVGSHCPGV